MTNRCPECEMHLYPRPKKEVTHERFDSSKLIQYELIECLKSNFRLKSNRWREHPLPMASRISSNELEKAYEKHGAAILRVSYAILRNKSEAEDLVHDVFLRFWKSGKFDSERGNDLSYLLTLTKLEEFLLQYKGCLILVSHDRFFMDKLTEHLFVFNGDGKIEDHYCTYSEYREQQIKEEKVLKKTQHLEKAKSKIKSPNKKLTFNDQFEYSNLEKELSELEKEKIELENYIQSRDIELSQMIEKSERLGVVINLIDEKEMRWMELDEMQ